MFEFFIIIKGECIQSYKGHSALVVCIRVINEKQFLTCSKDSYAKLWDMETGACLRTYTGHNHGICKIELTFDASHFITSSYDRTIKVWKIDKSECLHTLDAYAIVYSMVLLDCDNLYGGTVEGYIKVNYSIFIQRS